MEQMNNIQNLNLGWFGVEQAEEFDSDEEFLSFMGDYAVMVASGQGSSLQIRTDITGSTTFGR